MHSPAQTLRPVRRRAFIATLGVFVLLAVAVSPVAAYDPIDLFEHEPTPTPKAETVAPEPTPPSPPSTPPSTPVRRPTPAPEPEPATTLGHDVSWPQCNDELPDEFAFAIVGVNRGRPFSQNGCLAGQLEWAGRDADFYLNTANPGPDESSFWPTGQSEPRECATGRTDDEDTRDCAYLYGWNAAADGYARVLEAFIGLGWADADAERVPGEATWWLDVETANSWRGDRSLNVSTLQGAVDYLESRGVEEVGFYSTPLLWFRVTHGTDVFDGYPAWHAGASDEDEALERCEDRAFTGGELRMVQWIEDGIDTNVRCP